jgi:hypothetical protein
MSVGGNGEIEWPVGERPQLRELRHKVNHSLAQQRLATGDADLLDAARNEQPGNAQVVGKT